MLEKVTDCKGRCVCYVDSETGLIKQEYRRVKTTTHIPVGGEFIIEREGVITSLYRVSEIKFSISSYYIAA